LQPEVFRIGGVEGLSKADVESRIAACEEQGRILNMGEGSYLKMAR
jgi:hypothetical protein